MIDKFCWLYRKLDGFIRFIRRESSVYFLFVFIFLFLPSLKFGATASKDYNCVYFFFFYSTLVNLRNGARDNCWIHLDMIDVDFEWLLCRSTARGPLWFFSSPWSAYARGLITIFWYYTQKAAAGDPPPSINPSFHSFLHKAVIVWNRSLKRGRAFAFNQSAKYVLNSVNKIRGLV